MRARSRRSARRTARSQGKRSATRRRSTVPASSREQTSRPNQQNENEYGVGQEYLERRIGEVDAKALDLSEENAAEHAAGEAAKSAERDHDQCGDEIRRPHIRRYEIDHRQQRARDPGEGQSEA